MNQRIESIVSKCFSCQISTNTHHTEPAKMTNLPEKPWEIVEADFCGPFPNHEYALVVTDQYSRYPDVEFVRSTSIKPVRKKLKKIFATHGIPKKVQTDNGPPFNSKDFKEFAVETGFQHKTVTPRHPKAQGQVEGFNKLVNKTATIANQEGIDVHEATYDMLQAYRSTPHPAMKETPYELMMNRQVRTKIEHFPTASSPKDKEVRSNDTRYKQQVKQYHDKRHKAKQHKLEVGNAVIVKREKKRKAETPFEPHIYIITGIKGSTIYARRLNDGKTTCRDASRFKRLKTATVNHEDDDETPGDTTPQQIQIPHSCSAQSINKEKTHHTGEVVDQQENVQTTTETQPRRSTRTRTSVFDRHFKDFTR